MEIIPKSKDGWAAIKWATVEVSVRKLQKRIYLASKTGDIKKVRKMQNTLIKSFNGKLLATRRVTQDNSGKKTAGIDGIKSLKPTLRLELAKTMRIKGSAKPLRRVWIPKPGKTEKRPLGIPVMADRVNQALLKLAIEPEWEAKFEPHSYGFRPGRKPHDAIKQIYLSIKEMPKYVLDADISKCFDKIDHNKLLNKLGFHKGKFHRQIKAWLKSGVIDQEVFSKTEAGTPQGGVISPLLANIALHGMETMLKEFVGTLKIRNSKGIIMSKRDKMQSLSIIRYADDFVVMHFSKEVIIKCEEKLKIWLAEIGLELSKEKTRITHTLELSEIDKSQFNVEKPGFDFLGFTIRQFRSKYGSGKLDGINTLIWPSNKSCKRHSELMGRTIRKFSVLSQEKLIKKLNPIIRGWAQYFGLSDGITFGTLQKMDYLLYLKLRRWAKRKTKKGSAAAKKYWDFSNGKWEFNAKNVKLCKYCNYSDSIRNYVKVIGDSSPFDGNETYWASRLGVNPLMSKSHVALLQRQKGTCNLCKLKFFDGDILEIDHIIPLAKGGGLSYSNIQLLHKHCHDQKDLFDKANSEAP
jgi:RNA-directed DNA polymerase